MAKLICLQAGHEGVTSGVTGAPGEQELNVRIRNRLSQILISKGFVLQLVNANPPTSQIAKDFDLFLALHGDANIYGTGGGVVAYISPLIDSSPESNAESKRIKDCIESEYFKNSGIVNHLERNNANMTEYYMWSELSAKTPCVIMEMGVVQDAHDKVILADTDRVANAIARGICKAFNVPFDTTTPPPVTTGTTITIQKTEYDALKAKVASLTGQLVNKDNECQIKLRDQKEDLIGEIITMAKGL
jgi:N-acetylmuramoyl-L-alanine amidase